VSQGGTWAGVAPSILSADFARLGGQIGEVLEAGAKVIHVDVMDGHFVPPITMGPLVVGAIAEQVHAAGAVVDVHLMIERPERQVQAFADAGADGITLHVEATPHVHYALQAVREAGCRAGVALNPGTPPEAVSAVAADADLVLCMTVNPGWGGQRFLEASPGRIERLRAMAGPDTVVEVDGGIGAETAARCAAAGAGLFVAGSAVFGAPDAAAAVREIRSAAGKAGSH
jgi:ribulose-phosphate 3-epimerase